MRNNAYTIHVRLKVFSQIGVGHQNNENNESVATLNNSRNKGVFFAKY